MRLRPRYDPVLLMLRDELPPELVDYIIMQYYLPLRAVPAYNLRLRTRNGRLDLRPRHRAHRHGHRRRHPLRLRGVGAARTDSA